MKYHIGSTKIFENLPKLIEIEKKPYILTQDLEKNFVIYSAVCPHQQNVVSDLKKDVWHCPSHDWTFDPANGNCLNIPNESLDKTNIEIENEQVYIHLDKIGKEIISKSNKEKIPPKITVVGSAALLIEWQGYTILTDPWLDGLAVFESWINYPPSGIKFEELPKIDAIWISHEHSDHLHPPTLSRFDKKIPVYIPDFDNTRLEKKIRNLGFTNVFSMQPRRIYNLTSDIKAVSFPSGSVFNDSILYLQLGNFSILNVNDAGFNWSVKTSVGDVDLLCLQFSPASSYPATWTHIEKKTKIKLNKERNAGFLRMLKQMTEACGAKYILPFANFNELFHKEHLKYVLETSKNRPNDVRKFFANSTLKVLDLLPGESWDGRNKKFVRRKDRELVYEKKYLISYLKKFQKSSNLKMTMPTNCNLSQNEIKRYFESFSGSELSKKVGDYTVLLKLKNNLTDLCGFIKFEDGKTTYHSTTVPKKAHLTMICPGNMVQEIIRNDLYWDEIISGYWCTFSRDPDIYNAAFMKLLHAPWQARPNYMGKDKLLEIKTTTSIADIIEQGGKESITIFEKYGFFCVGCTYAPGETIEEGCHKHGLDNKLIKKLISELEVVKSKNVDIKSKIRSNSSLKWEDQVKYVGHFG